MGNNLLNYTRVRHKTFFVFFLVNIITSIVGMVVIIGGPKPVLMVQSVNALLSIIFIFNIRKLLEHRWLRLTVLAYYFMVINLGMWIGMGSTHPLFLVYGIMLIQVLILTSNKNTRLIIIVGYVLVYLSLGFIDVYLRNLPLLQLAPLNHERLISVVSIVLGNLIILHINKSEIENLNNNIVHTSYIDELTKIKNRRAFFEDIKNLETAFKTTNINYLVIYLDIDDLKQINDHYGHSEGDRAICAISKIISAHIRSNDGFYRIGGDEFVLLFSGVNGTEVLKKFDQIRDTLNQANDFKYHLDFSYGYANRSDFQSMESTMKSADDFMYVAKAKKKNERTSEKGIF